MLNLVYLSVHNVFLLLSSSCPYSKILLIIFENLYLKNKNMVIFVVAAESILGIPNKIFWTTSGHSHLIF
ncbi:unnamed protein product [Musa textilis]